MNISLRNCYDNFTAYVRRQHRLNNCKKDFAIRDRRIFKGLTPEQKNEVRAMWRKHGITSFNIGWVDFYSSFHGAYDKRFIPNDLYFSRIDLFYSNAGSCQHLDDKNNYNLLFEGFKQPRTIVRKVHGTFLDRNYRTLTYEEALQLCRAEEGVIRKPSTMSCGGYGIRFWHAQDDVQELEHLLHASYDYVIQEVVKQHPVMRSLHRESLNTLRIMTLFIDGEVKVLSTIVRMGMNGQQVDNMHFGGYACGVCPDGRLKKFAFNKIGDRIEQHPQGAVFANVVVPHYAECLALVRQMALRVLGYTRLVSWDVAIDESGSPILVEANLTTGGIDIHQMANGPLFGDLTERVLDEVFATRS